jgi:hypothetical protein
MLKKFAHHIKNKTLINVLLNLARKPLNRFNDRYPLLFSRDIYNKLKYGMSAPINHERIWVNPAEVKQMLVPSEVKRITGKTRLHTSGMIIDWNEVEKTRPVRDEFKIKYCIDHWVHGKSWEELQVIDWLQKNSKKHRVRTREELENRFKELDLAFQEVKKDGRLKTRGEIEENNYREKEGILIHIGKNGEPFFGSCGNHRLAMAIILELERIPAWLGLVDKDAIKHLEKYRIKPKH